MRNALLASLLVAGCAAPARSPANVAPTNRATPHIYQLVPLSLHGNEGRHSASHSSTSVSGSLTLDGPNATLALTMVTSTSFVHCPQHPKGDFSRQACVSRDTQNISNTNTAILRGETRIEHGVLVGTLRDGTRALALSCNPSFIGYACSVGGEVFGWGRSVPRTIAFAASAPKRFELVPLDAAGVGRVAGAIEMTNARSIVVSLSVDNGPLVTLPGSVIHQDTDGGGHGLLFAAQTSPTRTVTARCKIANDKLDCELTADRSVLGKPDHVMSSTVWLAKR